MASTPLDSTSEGPNETGTLAWARLAYEDVRDAELAFLHGLPAEDKRRMFPQWRRGPFPAHTILSCGELAMVLLGAKPSCMVAFAGWDDYGTRWARAVLTPWFQRHKLDERGFKTGRVAGINGSLIPADSDRVVWRDFPKGHAGSALFYNLNHADIAHVRKAFNGKHAGITDRDIGRALGYPTRSGSNMTVYYHAKDPSLFRPPESNEDVSSVTLLEYWCHPALSDAAAVGKHFRAVANALSQIGLEIALDVELCPEWGWRGLEILVREAFPGRNFVDVLNSKDLISVDWMLEAFRRNAGHPSARR